MATNLISAEFLEAHSDRPRPNGEAHSSGVAWGAVIGGAFVAAATYLILLALGAGFGLSIVSPWSNIGPSASTMGVAAIVWLVVIEIAASAMGGYLTGRLRTKWTLLHSDEVHFRDTANGFLAWAVAMVVSVTFLASAAAYLAGGAARLGSEQFGAAGENTGTVASVADSNRYFTDTLFRSDHPGLGADTSAQAEAGLILSNALRQDQIAAADQNYLARLVAAKTGIGLPEAEIRVSNVLADARKTADDARKATARFLLWLFLSLLMGAFSASWAATIGGRQRDHVKPV